MLRFERLKITNFGPFKGEQSIEFTQNNGVTIVWGYNGRGKTSLLNVFRYALFGYVKYRRGTTTDYIALTNEEAKSDGKYGFSISLKMSNDGDNYTLKRGVHLRDGIYTPSTNEDFIEDFFLKKNGTILSVSDRDHEIKQIMPPDISRFFLFDGELLQEYETLLDDTSDEGRVIKSSIEKILGMPVLTNAKADISDLVSSYITAKNKAAQNDKNTADYANKIDALLAEIDGHKAEMDRLERELESEQNNCASIQKKMDDTDKLRTLLSRETVTDACNLQISQSTRLHKMLVQYKKDIADYKSKLKEAQSRPYYNPRHNKPENEPAFFKEMSDECMSRAIAILDTVFKSIESLGGSINSDLSVKIRDDIVRFRMVESQDQVKHEMTKQEAQELVKYNDDIKNHRWASKPQIRKYDKVYNGKLRIEFGERSYIRDNDSEKLEDRLGDILVTLYEKAEENRIVREAREESERKRVEEARCREENRQRKEQEIRLVKELVNKAEDYRIAKEIREYIQAMIDSGNEDITPEWIEWALKKADWYDPSIETEDEYLGKRQHEKSAEEKEKSLQDSIRKSWYW